MIFGVQRRTALLQCPLKALTYAVKNIKFRSEERRPRFTTMVLNDTVGPKEKGHHGYFL